MSQHSRSLAALLLVLITAATLPSGVAAETNVTAPVQLPPQTINVPRHNTTALWVVLGVVVVTLIAIDSAHCDHDPNSARCSSDESSNDDLNDATSALLRRTPSRQVRVAIPLFSR